MNIRRGLLRLLVVASIAWITAVAFHAYTLSIAPRVGYTLELPPGRKFAEPATQELLDRLVERDMIRSHAEWAPVPPLGLVIIGAALWWAVAGFRRT
jgi:hypothetical protein